MGLQPRACGAWMPCLRLIARAPVSLFVATPAGGVWKAVAKLLPPPPPPTFPAASPTCRAASPWRAAPAASGRRSPSCCRPSASATEPRWWASTRTSRSPPLQTDGRYVGLLSYSAGRECRGRECRGGSALLKRRRHGCERPRCALPLLSTEPPPLCLAFWTRVSQRAKHTSASVARSWPPSPPSIPWLTASSASLTLSTCAGSVRCADLHHPPGHHPALAGPARVGRRPAALVQPHHRLWWVAPGTCGILEGSCGRHLVRCKQLGCIVCGGGRRAASVGLRKGPRLRRTHPARAAPTPCRRHPRPVPPRPQVLAVLP